MQQQYSKDEIKDKIRKLVKDSTIDDIFSSYFKTFMTTSFCTIFLSIVLLLFTNVFIALAGLLTTSIIIPVVIPMITKNLYYVFLSKIGKLDKKISKIDGVSELLQKNNELEMKLVDKQSDSNARKEEEPFKIAQVISHNDYVAHDFIEQGHIDTLNEEAESTHRKR